MRTKKFKNPARLFDLSANPSVFVQMDMCLTCVRFGMCVNPSVILSVFDIGQSIGICAADTCLTCVGFWMCVNLSVLFVGKSVGVPVGDCGTIP
jgi:hypothetical protein